MRAATHIWTFGAVLGVVSALRFVFPAHYGADLQRAASGAAASQSREVEATWRAQAYSGFSAAKVARAALATAPLGELSKAQQTALRVRLPQVLAYLEHPTLREYCRLKTDGFHWTFAPSPRALALLGPSVGRPAGPHGPQDFVRLLWEKLHGGPKPCLPRLTAVCLWTVRGGIDHTNAPALLLIGPVKNGFTVSYAATDPGFVYTGTRTPGRPLVFEVSFLAKANGGQNAGPVYISLLWVEGDQNWALSHLMTDGWLHINTIF